MRLTELKKWYERYQIFWDEYKSYTYNGFTSKQILAIEIFRENKFFLNTEKLEWFHRPDTIKERLISPLIKTFEDNYSEYKDWVINKFRFYLYQNASEIGWDYFFNSAIEDLPLQNEVILKFKAFRCKTVNEILNLYDISVFSSDKKFEVLSRFYLNQDPEQEGWDYFFDIPLETLPIGEYTLTNMKKLGCDTFQDVYNRFGKVQFHEPGIFEKVLEFGTHLTNGNYHSFS